jgi:hypothetical protein
MSLQLINLDSLPKSSSPHIWADYIELLCLVNVDRMISKADLLDRIQERKDLGGEIDGDEEEKDLDVEPSLAAVDDKFVRQVEEWFQHLEYRAHVFNEFYPFYQSPDYLFRLREEITKEHLLYFFLLLSSSLRYIKGRKSLLTGCFEVISARALKAALPKGAEVHLFGSSNPIKARTRYKGHLWHKINQLARDIGEKVIVPESEFSKYNVGDKGLDVVGWVPLGDKASGLLLVFGQCACTEDWVKKQHSSHASAWRSTMTFIAPPSNMAFIPFCFRNIDGSWHKARNIYESIVVDRQRLIYLLRDNYHTFILEVPCFEAVEKVLQQQEYLF